MQNIRVASVQFESVSGDKQANLFKIQYFVARAAREGVEIIVFPECCITGYWFLRNFSLEQMTAISEPVFDGPSSQFLMALAKKHKMTIGAGLFEIDKDSKIYNTFVIAMPDGKFARHRKLHAFVNKNLTAGNEYTVFDTPHGCRIGVLICYDNNIIENARITALKGAEILLAPHQTGGTKSPSPHAMGLIDPELWKNRHKNPQAIDAEFRGPKGRGWITTWLPARAHDNGMFLIYSNGVGIDDNEVRTGNSMIIDCYGRIITETCKADDDMVIADLDASLREKCTGVRWMRSRRPELYQPIVIPTGKEQDTRTTRFEGQKI
jgi:predicted amidohydrolase